MCIKILGTCAIIALTNGGTMNVDLPKTALSYDGKARSVERFYTPETRPFNIGGVIAFDNTLINLQYNNGIDTEKLDINQSGNISVTQRFNITENVSIDATVGTTIGGEVRHTKCTDSIGKEYYCGNLTAWSDFKESKTEQYRMGKLQLNYRF